MRLGEYVTPLTLPRRVIPTYSIHVAEGVTEATSTAEILGRETKRLGFTGGHCKREKHSGSPSIATRTVT